MTFRLRAKGFPSLPAKDERVPATLAELADAITIVGRRLPLKMGDVFAWHEMVGLHHQTLAYVERTRKGFVLSPQVKRLDGSEKAAFAYRAGMGLAHLAAVRHLGVRQTLHVDTMVKEECVTFVSGGRSRPDLLAQDAKKRWHVIEVKGRSRAPGPKLMAKAKEQAKKIALVNGVAPASFVGAVAVLGRKPMSLDFEDPPAPDATQVVTVDRVKAADWELAPFRGARRTTESSSVRLPTLETTARLWPIPGTPHEVGLLEPLAQLLDDPEAFLEERLRFAGRASEHVVGTRGETLMALAVDATGRVVSTRT